MTEKEKIKLKVKLFQKGYNIEKINDLIKFKELEENPNLEEILSKYKLKNGDKVKLNYEQITSHPDYIKNKNSLEKHVIEYHEFVENNKDKILTIEANDKYKTLVTFEEDTRDKNIKWLFNWIDLVKIN